MCETPHAFGYRALINQKYTASMFCSSLASRPRLRRCSSFGWKPGVHPAKDSLRHDKDVSVAEFNSLACGGMASVAATLGAIKDNRASLVLWQEAPEIFICNRSCPGNVVAFIDLGFIDINEEHARLALQSACLPKGYQRILLTLYGCGSESWNDKCSQNKNDGEITHEALLSTATDSGRVLQAMARTTLPDGITTSWLAACFPLGESRWLPQQAPSPPSPFATCSQVREHPTNHPSVLSR